MNMVQRFHKVLFLIPLAALLLLLFAASATAGTIWVEDWTSGNLDKWYFHTYNEYGPVYIDSYDFKTGPNRIEMTGNSWGLETKQNFSQHAPISVEALVRTAAVTPNTKSFAGVTVYTGEGVYEEIALMDNLDSRGLHVRRVNEADSQILQGKAGSAFPLNSNLNHNDYYRLKIEHDGKGTWRFYVNGVHLHTVYDRKPTSPPNIFILSVADLSAALGQNKSVKSEFQQMNVVANYNLEARTTWVNFTNHEINQRVETGRNCPWGFAVPPQCDYLALMQATTPVPPSPATYFASGFSRTHAVTLPAGMTWGEMMFTAALDGQSIVFRVLDQNNNLVPDAHLPGNAVGFRKSNIDLSGLDPTKYPRLKLIASFSTGSILKTPRLLDWTLTYGLNYYFTWYDQQDPDMSNWVLMSNANDFSGDSRFKSQLGSPQARGPAYDEAQPGETAYRTFPGVADGPLTVNSLSGVRQMISQRVLYKDTLDENIAIPADRLSDHYYWAWYDELSPGYRNWVLVANPDRKNQVYYEIRIAGSVVKAGTIGPGGRVTPDFPGVMGGPVEVRAWTGPGKAAPASVIASQRVLADGASFNEVYGVPAAELSSDYLWTWYDQLSGGAKNWVLVANPNPYDIYYEILIGGRSRASGKVPPGANTTPMFDGVMGGPVQVKAWRDAVGGAVPAVVIASQRSIWGGAFEEVPGYDSGALDSKYSWTWYDSASLPAQNWVVIINPTNESITAEVLIEGEIKGRYDLAPYGHASGNFKVTPVFPGLMGGPVEVRAYRQNTSYTFSVNRRPVLASQRVLWSGHLNEVVGTVIGD